APSSLLFPYTTLFRSGERRQRPRVPQHAEHVVGVLVDQRLDEDLVLVLQRQIDDHLDRVDTALRRQLRDRGIVPVDALHRVEVRSEEHTSELQSLAYL